MRFAPPLVPLLLGAALASACGEDTASSSDDASISEPVADAAPGAGDAATPSDASSPRPDASGSGADAGGDASTGTPDPDAGATPDAGGGDRDTICAEAAEGQAATLTCPDGKIISEIVFAGYGTPNGSCGGFSPGSCDAATAKTIVSEQCIGRKSCIVMATNARFGDPCNSTVKKLAIEARCVVGTPTIPPEPFKGVANSPCDARRALNVSWYYNWMQSENEPCPDATGGAFVPMIWGHTGAEQDPAKIKASVASFASRGYPYVLGFNEPDNATQSNLTVSAAIGLWPSFADPGIKIASPATQANTTGQAWFKDFMTKVNAGPELRTDVMALHWYGWNAGSCDPAAAQLENYLKWAEGIAGDRPIWLTEWGCLNQSAPTEDTVVKFFQGALAVFDRHPRVQRYAWYPWATNCGLVNADGSLTALGKVYAAAPATR